MSLVAKQNMDKIITIKPFWYIEIDTLVAILQVIKDLDEDLKRKIVLIITLINKKEEERQELIHNSYNFHNEIDMMNAIYQNLDIEYYYSD